jgi:hypothetical protein
MDNVQTKREEPELNWADLVDAWRAQAWERAYAPVAPPSAASVAFRRDAKLEHRRDSQQQL